MPMWIKNYIVQLLAVFFITCFIIMQGHIFRPLIFHPTHHRHRIFPPDARLMDVMNLPYIIPNYNQCTKARHVIVVHSAPGHFDRRSDFRETWANPSVLNSTQTKLVFIIGRSRDDLVQNALRKENDLHLDIIQGDFIDDYTNLTLKAVTGLRWVTENCIDARAVFKIDDDVFLDINKAMVEIVPLLEENPRQIVCSVEPRANIFRNGDSDTNNKWKIPDSYFSNLRRYPMPFCYGFGVFMSLELAYELFELSKSTPFYRLDDVFMYGIVANKVKGLSWRSEEHLFNKDPNVTLSVFRQQVPNGLLVGTVRSREATLELWELTRLLHKATAALQTVKRK